MILGYSDFLNSLDRNLFLKEGIFVDTNILLSATYDSDPFFDRTNEFLDLVMENEIPIYCNVSVRAEFLEIHRRITNGQKDLWTVLCEHKIGNKLGFVWYQTVEKFGLNVVSLRNEDQNTVLVKALDWDDVVKIIEKYGSSSSDAMIINVFVASKFEALITSDLEVALTIRKMKPPGKICFVPDKISPTTPI